MNMLYWFGGIIFALFILFIFRKIIRKTLLVAWNSHRFEDYSGQRQMSSLRVSPNFFLGGKKPDKVEAFWLEWDWFSKNVLKAPGQGTWVVRLLWPDKNKKVELFYKNEIFFTPQWELTVPE